MDTDEAFWDELYGTAPALWSGEPNHQLVAETGHLVPRSALDVGCGEGADALWLARRGWRVTGIDISVVALARARHVVAREPVGVADRITWVHGDLLAWDPPAGGYGLVSAQYFHLPQRLRSEVWNRVVGAVAPGGTLLVDGHDLSDPRGAQHRHEHADHYFSSVEITERLAESDWTITTDTVARNPRAGGSHSADLVISALRRPVGPVEG